MTANSRSLAQRLPAKPDIIRIAAVVVFSFHLWSILSVLWEVPSWLMRMSIGQAIAVFAYTQMYALLENLGVVLVILAVALVCPPRLCRGHFVSLVTMLIVVNTIWLVLIQWQFETLRNLNQVNLGLVGLIYLTTNALALLASYTIKGIDIWVRQVLDRVAIIAGLYVLIDVVSLFIVVIRNVRGLL
jgi:hypothetical protein